MYPLLLNVVLGLGVGPTVDLNKMTVGDAVSLHGQMVRASLDVGQPTYTQGGWTVAGCEVANVERGVMLPGRWQVDQGDNVTVLGRLKVVTTPAAVVNGQNVPAMTSVVVVGVRVR